MNLDEFRSKVQAYRKRSGYTQNQLAAELGIQPEVLSRKLSGKRLNATLTHPEIKQIIKTLVKWQALTTTTQVRELLELAGLPSTSFNSLEWQTFPLNLLEDELSGLQTSMVSSEAAAEPNLVSSKRLKTVPQELSNDIIPAASWTSAHIGPASLTSLVGREWETRLVGEWFSANTVRLVTLVGPGGIGKTRLALTVANALKNNFAGGVFFVNLAGTNDPEMVLPSVVQALQLVKSDRLSLNEVLKNYLRHKEILLVLDNFEQHVEAAPLISEWLNEAAALKILVTSRRVLSLYGERQFEVPPLRLPDFSNLPANPNELLQYEAIALFVARVQDYNYNFELNRHNAVAVARICSLLDGLPLALELAAAHIKYLTPQQLLTRLEEQEQQLKLLGTSRRDLPLRQQTLTNTLDWSYNLLDEKEQILLRRLAVFGQSWSLAMAEAVCATGGLSEWEIAPLVGRLVDHSLVIIEKAGQSDEEPARYYLLQTIRNYAFEKLIAAGESLTWEKAFNAFFELAYSLEGSNHFQSYFYYNEAFQALSYLPDDNPTHQRSRVDMLLGKMRVALTTTDLLELRNQLETATATIQALLGGISPNDADLRRLGWLQYWLGTSYYLSREFEQAFNYFQASLELARQLKEEQLQIKIESTFTSVQVLRGYFNQALPMLHHSKLFFEKTANWAEWAILTSYQASALAATGTFQEALDELEKARVRAYQVNNLKIIGLVYLYYAIVHFLNLDAKKVLENSQACIETLKDTNEQLNLLPALGLRGWAESKLGDTEAARRSLAQIAPLRGSIWGEGKLLLGASINIALLAEINLNIGEFDEAISLAERAVEMARPIQDVQGGGLAQRTWGCALAKKGERREEAEKHLETAIQLFETGGALLEIAHTYTMWGKLCQEWGDPEKAQACYNKITIKLDFAF
jgi:predicted ATPase/transcriptional regulator with XRE-family HTH domain